jgi:hypothetical protein
MEAGISGMVTTWVVTVGETFLREGTLCEQQALKDRSIPVREKNLRSIEILN